MTKNGYHHGDLTNALLAAALARVEQDGADAVSLRDLAQALGVSRAAPYRHFPDRDALLAAVAARGFEDLVAEYEAVLAAPCSDDADLPQRGWLVYLDFARRRPGLFRLMFDSDFLGRDRPPAVLIPPANRAYQLLWEAMRRAHPGKDDREIKKRTLTGWSTIYGYIALNRGRRFKTFMTEPLSEEEVVDAVLDASCRGVVAGGRGVILTEAAPDHQPVNTTSADPAPVPPGSSGSVRG
jgi:AcrR family transcriptional regulator